MKTKRLLFCTALGAVVAVAVTMAVRARGTTATPSAAAPAEPAEGQPVRTVTIQGQPFDETIVATGTVRADESIEVRAEISGKITRIHFQEGSPVRAGELLVSINDAELRASLQRAVYRRELAELKTKRLSTLRNQGGVTQQDYDIAVSELNVLTAEVALIQAQLDHMEIRAPFDGVVGLRSVSEGAFVTPTTRIATFQRLDRLKVDFSIPEKYATRVSADAPVVVTLAGSTQPLTGKIHAIEPLVDAATRTVLVRAVCPNPSGRLFSGGFVSVKLALARLPDAILVPALALVPGAADQSVFVVENGQARRRAVKTGTRTESTVQILDGLKPGDRLIVSGLQQLRPGLPVRPLGDDPRPSAANAGKGNGHQTPAAVN